MTLQVGQSLESILKQAREVEGLVDAIAQACGEQTTGIIQISQAVQQISLVTQGNVAAAEETATTAHKLEQRSESLRKAVHNLEQIVFGGASRQGDAASPAGLAPRVHPVPGIPEQSSLHRNSTKDSRFMVGA